MKLNPDGLSGLLLQLSEDQLQAGFLALREAVKLAMLTLKSRRSVAALVHFAARGSSAALSPSPVGRALVAAAKRARMERKAFILIFGIGIQKNECRID